ncbi:response regulator transcription factor [Aliiroseovarius marinus]|uniref:response regulator transcription factor n=1 Tax=Aliiroseovarius marinus TaxID=2500159 RepID=UPI003D7C50FE
MNRDLLEAAYRLETAMSLEKTWRTISDVMTSHQLNRMYYIMRDDGAVPNWFVLSNLPSHWPLQETKKPGFFEPFVAHCCATFEPTKVGVEFVDRHQGYIDDQTRQYISEVAKFDWTAGLGFPCGLIGSGQYGGFLIGNDMNRHDFERSVLPLVDQLQSFCLIAHRKIDDWRRKHAEISPRRRLSAREHQVLELMSKGLRPKAIAAHLDLSEASIRLYIKNARLKLGAATKEEALARFLQ